MIPVGIEYVFLASHDLLEEIDVGSWHWREIGLTILQKKVVELFLRLHLAAERVDANLGELYLNRGRYGV